MRRKSYSYTREEVNRLTRQSWQGNQEALKELKNYYSYLAKKANSRLYNLEKEGLDYYAYDYAQTFTQTAYNKKRYSTATQSPKAMREQIRNIEKFLSMKTSTVAQAKLVRDNRIEIFRQHFNVKYESERPLGDTSKEGLYMTDEDLQDFTRYLTSKPMRNLVSQSMYTSEEVVDVLREQYNKGGADSLKEIEALVSKWEYLKTMGLEDEEGYHFDNLWKEISKDTRIAKIQEEKRQKAIREALERQNPWRT